MDTVDTVDVVVVGSGAGLVGAFAAAARGLRTVVVERSEQLGGPPGASDGTLWLPGADGSGFDGAAGEDVPVPLRDAWARTAPQLIEELQETHWFPSFQDRAGPASGGRTVAGPDLLWAALGNLVALIRPPLDSEGWGTGIAPVMRGEQAFVGRMLLAYLETGWGAVRVDTAVEALVVEPSGVRGVTTRGGATIRAGRGVLLTEDPGFAAVGAGADQGTKGGLRTDERARVLRPDGTVVPGLYATGDAMAAGDDAERPDVRFGRAAAFAHLAILDLARS
ncbi:hypothetical protein Amsp01_049890 [Amycolatopsis sp. NBRC 101858]|nr:hypothetical protein Amsp01_049890 [Amycolatopsis sp. NBRC 101858]